MKPRKFRQEVFLARGTHAKQKHSGYLILELFMFCSGFIPWFYWVKAFSKTQHGFFS